MNNVQFATPGSGLLADKIGWISYDTGAVFTPGAPPVHIINAIPGGFTVEYDLSVVNVAGPGNNVPAVHTPTYSLAPFGNTGYTGIPGDIALFPHTTGVTHDELMKLDNIVVKNASGVVQSKFTWLAADAENTDSDETWIINTNGTPWKSFTVLPPVLGSPNSPAVSGLGTNTVTEVGTGINHAYGNVYSTIGPKNVSAEVITYGREGVVFGIIVDPFETAISDLIESIALEETGISHILNAEGEKIQAMLGIHGVTQEQLLAVNKSVQDMTNSINKLEAAMATKLNSVGIV